MRLNIRHCSRKVTEFPMAFLGNSLLEYYTLISKCERWDFPTGTFLHNGDTVTEVKVKDEKAFEMAT